MFSCCTSRGPTELQKLGVGECTQFEKKILESTGMKEKDDFKIYNQGISGGKHIHTIEAGFKNKQQVVLVHGYGATGVFYYKMIAQLRFSFHVYAIDLFGFGQSSRPAITDFSYNKCCMFFLDPFEEWRISLGIDDFVLVAHSMGGYLITQYMRIKKPPVKMFYLVSPAGFTLKTVDEIKERMSQYVSGFKMLTIKFSFYLMEDLRMSPFHLMFMNRDQALDNYFKNERMNMSEDEAKLFIEYFKLILNQAPCGEKALGSFLFYGCYSKNPLCDTLAKIRDDICNVRIFYGDADWMDFEHAIEVNLRKIKYDIQIVPNAGHQIILQNPNFLCKVMLEDLHSNYDPYKYFEQEYRQLAQYSYLTLDKGLLKFLGKNASDLTMMREQ